MSSVPIFAPDGSLGDIPAERLADAVKAGAKPGVTVKAPDGSIGVIPSNRMSDAVKAGGTIVPLTDQETQHPGFWSTVVNDFKGMLHPSGFSPYPGMDQEAKSAAATQSAQQDQSRKAAGYSLPYRVLAPVAQSVGVNVPGMEASAAEGDVAGVAGHAAAAAAPLVAGEVAAHGVPALANALPENTGAIATAPVRYAARAAEALANSKLKPFAQVMRPADEAAKASFQIPGRDYGLNTAEPSAPVAQPQTPAPQPPSTTPAAATDEPGTGAGIPRTLSGESALRDVLSRQDNANLLKIARSRGINVAQEAQLKPSAGDERLINKIINDFSDDELDGIRSQYMENTRMDRHSFGDIGAEANKTMAMQTYFPDVKISAATLKRTQGAIAGATPKPGTVAPAASADDTLLPQLQEMLRQAQAKKGLVTQ